MNPLISVIVPIYNVEKYLARCVDSIVNQIYKNLEIILVDDGSPDRCPQMCDDYAEKDSRIKVVHKKNGGLSDARNAGVAVATGEYISFIDSDDYVSDDFFECLLDVMNKENSDIAECSVVKLYEDGHLEQYTDSFEINSYNTQNALLMLISESHFKTQVWNKLYKSDLVLGVPFLKGKCNEDDFWTYQVFAKANKVSLICQTMYFYFQRSNSIMGGNYSVKRLDEIEAKCIRQKYIEGNYPDIAINSKLNFFCSCMFSYQSVLKYLTGEDKKTSANKILNYLKIAKLSWKEILQLGLLTNCWFVFSKISFRLCCRVRNIFGIGF